MNSEMDSEMNSEKEINIDDKKETIIEDLKKINIDDDEETIIEGFNKMGFKYDIELEKAKDIFLNAKKFGLNSDLSLEEMIECYKNEIYDFEECCHMAFIKLLNHEIKPLAYYSFISYIRDVL